MDPLGGVDPWSLVLAGVVAAVLLAVVGTWPVCALLLRMYRRRIDRGMRTVAGPAPANAPSMPPDDGDNRRIAVREVEVWGHPPLLEQARRKARRSQLLFALLGLVYGMAAAAAYHIVDQAQWRPVRVAAYTLLLGWPVAADAARLVHRASPDLVAELGGLCCGRRHLARTRRRIDD